MKRISVLAVFLVLAQITIFAAVAKDTFNSLSTINDVLFLLKDRYVKPDMINLDTVTYDAVNGMLKSLDPHTNYFSKEELENFESDIEGVYDGLGIEIDKQGDYIIVVSPFEGSPAEQFGLRPGDKIAEVDGESVVGISTTDITKKLRGPAGTKVKVGVLRDGRSEITVFTITRAEIQSKSIRLAYMITPDTGYVKFNQFQDNSLKEMKDELSKLTQAGMKQLVLDLRGNPGGLLHIAYKIADLFIEDGIIVTTRGRNKDDEEVYRATKKSPYKDLPLIVVVDEGSASASEIFAGAMKDLKRALLIGDKTYGKGSVQQTYPLRDGSGLKMTIAYYYTPSGVCVDKNGIVPDIVVPAPPLSVQMSELLKDNWFLRYAEKNAQKYTVLPDRSVSPDPTDDFIAYLHAEKVDVESVLLPDPVLKNAMRTVEGWEKRVVAAMKADLVRQLTFTIIQKKVSYNEARKGITEKDPVIIRALTVLHDKK